MSFLQVYILCCIKRRAGRIYADTLLHYDIKCSWLFCRIFLIVQLVLIRRWSWFSSFSSLFRLGKVMCMGVTAGAYVLTLFAVSYFPVVCVLFLFSWFIYSYLIWSSDEEIFTLFFPDKIYTKGYGFDAHFPFVPSTILDRMVVQ